MLSDLKYVAALVWAELLDKLLPLGSAEALLAVLAFASALWRGSVS